MDAYLKKLKQKCKYQQIFTLLLFTLVIIIDYNTLILLLIFFLNIITISKFFHNIRLEIFIVRRVWKPLLSKFLVQRSAMLFNESEHWTAKLRFRSL